MLIAEFGSDPPPQEFKKLLHFLAYFNDLWHHFEEIDKVWCLRLPIRGQQLMRPY